jgi:hypothetical protein
VDIERGSLCPEKRSSAVRGESAACSAVRCALRFVTAANRVLLPLGDGGISAFSVFVSAVPVTFWFSGFPATARFSAPVLKMTPVMD